MELIIAGTCSVAFVRASIGSCSLLTLVDLGHVVLFNRLYEYGFDLNCCQVLTQTVARYGAGYHAWEIRKPEYYNWLKVSYPSQLRLG